MSGREVALAPMRQGSAFEFTMGDHVLFGIAFHSEQGVGCSRSVAPAAVKATPRRPLLPWQAELLFQLANCLGKCRLQGEPFTADILPASMTILNDRSKLKFKAITVG